MNDTESYYLYILCCDNTFLYTGIALDPLKRLKQHQAGKPHGAKYTRRFSHLELVYQVIIGNRSDAQKCEYYLKRCTKVKKESIIKDQPDKTGLFKILSL